MTRSKINLQQITDEKSRQATFVKRKQGLMRRAMELSVLCDCEVGLIIFSPSGELFQYSSMDMDALLDKYSAACTIPHERRRNDELLRQHYMRSDEPAGPSGQQELRNNTNLLKRMREADPGGGPGRKVGLGGASAPLVVEGVKQAGFLDKCNYPVSPRSEKAYEEITAEFDKLYELTQQRQGQPGGPPGAMQPLSSAATAAGAAAGQAGPAPGAGKRYKPLSIVVPDSAGQMQLHAISMPQPAGTAAQQQHAAAAAPVGPSAASAAGASTSGQGQAPHRPAMQHAPAPAATMQQEQQGQAMQQQQQQQQGHQSLQGLRPLPLPGLGAAALTNGRGGNGPGMIQLPLDAQVPMEEDTEPAPSNSGGGGFTFSGGDRKDDTSMYLRMSMDGSAANLLNIPSPPPTHLFGPLSGEGLLSSRSLGALGLDLPTPDSNYRAALGLGLAGMSRLGSVEALDWHMSSPRSSVGNGASGFASDEGEGGQVVEGLVVTGTALSKLPPEALEAAIGASPTSSAAAGSGRAFPNSMRVLEAAAHAAGASKATADTSGTGSGVGPSTSAAAGLGALLQRQQQQAGQPGPGSSSHSLPAPGPALEGLGSELSFSAGFGPGAAMIAAARLAATAGAAGRDSPEQRSPNTANAIAQAHAHHRLSEAAVEPGSLPEGGSISGDLVPPNPALREPTPVLELPLLDI